MCAQGLAFGASLLWLRRAECTAILHTGLPTAVQMAVLNLSYLLVTGLFNTFGVTVAAAAGVRLKPNSYAALPCWAVGSAVTVLAGQCVGAGELSLAAMAAVQLFTAPLVAFFDPSPAVVVQGVRYLRICCSVNCLFYAAMCTYDAFATGVGAAGLAMANALLQSVGVRLALSLLLSGPLGADGLYLTEALVPPPC